LATAVTALDILFLDLDKVVGAGWHPSSIHEIYTTLMINDATNFYLHVSSWYPFLAPLGDFFMGHVIG
jgi:hypothetical protein